jgi:hypothetical protein
LGWIFALWQQCFLEKNSVNWKKILKNSKTQNWGKKKGKKLSRSMLFRLQKHPQNYLVNQEWCHVFFEMGEHITPCKAPAGTHPKSSTVLDVNSAMETNLIKW